MFPHTEHFRFFTPLRYRSRSISFCVNVLDVSGVPGVEPFGAGDDAVGVGLLSETLLADPSASIFSIRTG